MTLVKKAIIAELQELMPKSVTYSNEIKNARTETKRKILTKRLKKNNKKVAELITALEKIPEIKENESDTTEG